MQLKTDIHDAKEIRINTDRNGSTHWVEILVEDDNEVYEFTIFHDGNLQMKLGGKQ